MVSFFNCVALGKLSLNTVVKNRSILIMFLSVWLLIFTIHLHVLCVHLLKINRKIDTFWYKFLLMDNKFAFKIYIFYIYCNATHMA